MIPVAGGVAVMNCEDVRTRSHADLGIGLQRILEALHDQLRTDVRVAQPLRQPVAHALLRSWPG
jgi:hypothetical protein